MQRVTPKLKLFLFLVYALAYSVFYVLPNLNPLKEPIMLPMGTLDNLVPFIPITFLIYISDYLLIFSTIAMITGPREWKEFSSMAFTALILCGVCFLFFPTTYPRPAYPEVGNWLIASVMSLIGNADTPNNCFPSMHVAMTSVCVWCLRHRSKKLFFSYCIWAVAIFVSTMTTKQHYFIDVIGGLSVTTIAAVLAKYVFSRSKMFSWDLSGGYD